MKETGKHQKCEKVSPLEKTLKLETFPLKGLKFITTVQCVEEAVLINTYIKNIKL